MRWSLPFVAIASASLLAAGCASEADNRPYATAPGADDATDDATEPSGDEDVAGPAGEPIGPGAQPAPPAVLPSLPPADASADEPTVTPATPSPEDAADTPRTPKPVAEEGDPGAAAEGEDLAEGDAPGDDDAQGRPEEGAEGDADGPQDRPGDEDVDDEDLDGEGLDDDEGDQPPQEDGDQGGGDDLPQEDAGAPRDEPNEDAGDAGGAQGQPGDEAPEDEGDEPADEEPADEGICAQATAHLQRCVGIAIEPDACEGAAEEEAGLLLALSCEELEDLRGVGGGVAPLCAWLGWGCEDLNPCVPAFTPAEFQDVLRQTAVSTLQTASDVLTSLEGVTELMAPRDDPRGLFASTYLPITAVAVEAIEGGLFEDGEWAEALVVDFGARYLSNLRNHLLAGEVTLEWRRYYELAESCDVSRLRTVVSAMATHLIVDLPYALQAIETAPQREVDFTTFGDILVTATPTIIDDLRSDYGVDGEAILTGFFAGDVVDAALGELTTTAFLFRTVRSKAWTNGQLLLAPATAWIAFSEILSSWAAADALLVRLENQGTI